MNININDYIPSHKYIRLYENEIDYDNDVNNHIIEECAYSLVNKNNTEIQQSYYPSTRTTNNDNTVKFNYFDKDKINIWAGLSIIWGYFGFQKTTYELDGEQLTGGNFTFIKPMTVVKEIPDGYTLQHINDFLRYAPVNSITEIQFFDTTNIKSASYVFYHIKANCIIDTKLLINWSNLKIIISAFWDTAIYNVIKENIIIDFSSLEIGFNHINDKYITKILYDGVNWNDFYNYSSTYSDYIPHTVKFKLDSLQDEYFIDTISYNHIKYLFNNNILTFNFKDYSINFNNPNCYITYNVPIYNDFVYNYDTVQQNGAIFVLIKDSEYDYNDSITATFNINLTGTNFALINRTKNINNVYKFNFDDSNPVYFRCFYFSYIDTNNFIINKDYNIYGDFYFDNCTINKNIEGKGRINSCIVNSIVTSLNKTYFKYTYLNINNSNFNNAVNIYADSITHSNFTEIANINKFTTIDDCDFKKDLIINNDGKNGLIGDAVIKNSNLTNITSNINVRIYNSIINGNISINDTKSNLFTSFICSFNECDIKGNILLVTGFTFTISNCSIGGNLTVTTKSYHNFVLDNVTFSDNSIFTVNECFGLDLENIIFKHNINPIIYNSKNSDSRITVRNSYYIGENYFINIESYNTYSIYLVSLYFDDDETYDINNLINPNVEIVNFDIESNKLYSEITSVTANVTLTNQNEFTINVISYQDIHCYRRTVNDYAIISETITIINFNVKGICNRDNRFNFSQCINLENINITFENTNLSSEANQIDFSNCYNLNKDSLYNFLISFVTNIIGNTTIIIENAVYTLFTEDEITNILNANSIFNVLHKNDNT